MIWRDPLDPHPNSLPEIFYPQIIYVTILAWNLRSKLDNATSECTSPFHGLWSSDGTHFALANLGILRETVFCESFRQNKTVCDSLDRVSQRFARCFFCFRTRWARIGRFCAKCAYRFVRIGHLSSGKSIAMIAYLVCLLLMGRCSCAYNWFLCRQLCLGVFCLQLDCSCSCNSFTYDRAFLLTVGKCIQKAPRL